MVDPIFTPYNDTKHRPQFFEINVEYLHFIDDEVFTRKGYHLIPDGNVREYVESVFSSFTKLKPPEGIVYILEVNGKVMGMGALKKLEKGIGEIKRMYIRPELRGQGYGQKMLNLLEDKARELGYKNLRLDTGDFLEAAIHIYKKAGFQERGKYSGTESNGITVNAIYMEKKL